jgi:hypothetical protein
MTSVIVKIQIYVQLDKEEPRIENKETLHIDGGETNDRSLSKCLSKQTQLCVQGYNY